MKTGLIRKGSLGLKGTYANVGHHAQSAKPFVDFLVKLIPKTGFTEWRQGHNVHQLIKEDGLIIEFRPYYDSTTRKFGVEIWNRLARKMHTVLFQFTDMSQCEAVESLLMSLGRKLEKNTYGVRV